jgi:hypothetical protein
MQFIEVQQSTTTGKWAVISQSDESDYKGIVGGLVFDTKEEADAYANSMFPKTTKYGSKELIGNFEERFAELEDKAFDRRSFYNGWKEGRVELLKDFKQTK